MLEQRIEELSQKVDTLTNNIRQLMLAMQAGVKLLAGKYIDLGSPGEEKTATDKVIVTTDKVVVTTDKVVVTTDTPIPTGLPEGDIEWDNVDSMDCPYHTGMMTGTYTKAKTGANKGCWNKIKNIGYSADQYLLDRRVLIEFRADKLDAALAATEEKTPAKVDETAGPAPTSGTPKITPSGGPPQLHKLTPQRLVPQTELLDVDEEGISFTQVCERHIARHSNEQLQHCLLECGVKADHDFTTMEGTDEMEDIVPYIRDELIKHDAASA